MHSHNFKKKVEILNIIKKYFDILTEVFVSHMIYFYAFIVDSNMISKFIIIDSNLIIKIFKSIYFPNLLEI